MLWVLAIMVSLVLLALGAMLALGAAIDSQRARLDASSMVQIVIADRTARDAAAQRIATALRQDEAVAAVRIVPQDELQALLEPWLGGLANSDSVPIPALIDVTLRPDIAEEDRQRLSRMVTGISGQTRFDSQSAWLQPVYDALASLRYVALSVVVFLIGLSLMAVWLATRNALTANWKNIEVVHLLGGDDKQIAGLFQHTLLRDAVLGSVIGYAIGLASLLFLRSQFAALDMGVTTGGSLDEDAWVGLLIVPALAVASVVLTARLAVVSALRRML